jgi:hypothetical protein
MNLTVEQSRKLYLSTGNWLKEVCDKCGKGIHSAHASIGLRNDFQLEETRIFSDARYTAKPRGRHIVPIRLTNTPLWLYFKSVRSSEKLVKL